jgi:hypothetical protein
LSENFPQKMYQSRGKLIKGFVCLAINLAHLLNNLFLLYLEIGTSYGKSVRVKVQDEEISNNFCREKFTQKTYRVLQNWPFYKYHLEIDCYIMEL